MTNDDMDFIRAEINQLCYAYRDKSPNCISALRVLEIAIEKYYQQQQKEKEKMMDTTNVNPAEIINNVAEKCHYNSLSHGFWETDFNFGEKIALMHSELSEALEKHRKTVALGKNDEPDEHCPQHGGIAIELADVVIRVFDLAAHMKMNIGGAILDKMEFNKNRPHKHGKAY